MTAFDPVVNFAKSPIVGTLPTGSTTLTLASSWSSLFPTPSISGEYNVVFWNAKDYARAEDDPSKEILRVTAKGGTTLTITRAQEGTSQGDHVLEGNVYKIALTVTAKAISDIHTYKADLASPTFTGTVTTDITKANTIMAVGSGGLLIKANSGTDVALFGAGGGAGVTFYGGINGTTISLSSTVQLTGNASVPTISNDAYIFHTTASGLILAGQGSSNDITLLNSAGNNVCRVATGSTSVRFYGAPEPTSNDCCALGSARRSFSDLYLATGAVVNFNNGNYTLTHDTGRLTASGVLKTLSSVQSIYSLVTTVSSTDPNTYSQGLTTAGNLVSVPYQNMGVTSLLTFSTTDDNSSKPKASIITEMTSSGVGLYFGTSGSYAVGITNYGLALDYNGKVLFRTTTSATAQANFIPSFTPSSPVDGDWWYDGTNLKFRNGATTRTISWV